MTPGLSRMRMEPNGYVDSGIVYYKLKKFRIRKIVSKTFKDRLRVIRYEQRILGFIVEP